MSAYNTNCFGEEIIVEEKTHSVKKPKLLELIILLAAITTLIFFVFYAALPLLDRDIETVRRAYADEELKVYRATDTKNGNICYVAVVKNTGVSMTCKENGS